MQLKILCIDQSLAMFVGDFDISKHIINGNLQGRLRYFLYSLKDTQRDCTLKHSLHHIDNLINLH